MAQVRDRITSFFQKNVANPLMRLMPFQTLRETTGRKTGERRRTPLDGRRVGSQFWFVSEFGDKSQYVKNIRADPHVSVRLKGTWHSGKLCEAVGICTDWLRKHEFST